MFNRTPLIYNDKKIIYNLGNIRLQIRWFKRTPEIRYNLFNRF